MEMWSPVSASELEGIVASQLAECAQEQQLQFAACRVPLRSVPILRNGAFESVFVVAQRGDLVVYYEDIEEGFNISKLAPDGSIAEPGYEDWRLCHAMLRLAV
jgi:hypothetical protein